jgi:hypothetical protein
MLWSAEASRRDIGAYGHRPQDQDSALSRCYGLNQPYSMRGNCNGTAIMVDSLLINFSESDTAPTALFWRILALYALAHDRRE